MNRSPIKRHKSLQNLSREHHDGLTFSLRLSKGLTKNVDTKRLENYARWFWQSHLIDHFEMEEQHLFPLLDKDHPLLMKAIEQHEELRAFFKQEHLSRVAIQAIADLVKLHIRFEERELFMYIQEHVDKKELERFSKIHNQQKACPVWQDAFWLS